MKLTKVYQGSPYKNDNKLFEEKTENTRTVSHKNSQKEFIETQKEKEKKFVEKISNLSPIKQSKNLFNQMIKKSSSKTRQVIIECSFLQIH